MFEECHAHIFMNGTDYRKAVQTHKVQANEASVRSALEAYRKAGVTYVREGGDPYGASLLAGRLASEYGIEYRSPVFAIHKNGHYGKIVGRGFDTLKEYHQRVLEAASEGADFIKIMTTGLLDFNDDGKVTGTPVDEAEVREMVHIAHEEGFARYESYERDLWYKSCNRGRCGQSGTWQLHGCRNDSYAGRQQYRMGTNTCHGKKSGRLRAL